MKFAECSGALMVRGGALHVKSNPNPNIAAS